MENKSATQTKARVIVVAVFVLGLVAGGLSMTLYQRITNASDTHAGRPRGAKPQDYVLEKMNNTLNLTPDQQSSIREILKGTFEQYGDIKKDMEPRLDVVRQQGRQRIREVLRPDQLPKYEEMVRKHDSEREKMRSENR